MAVKELAESVQKEMHEGGVDPVETVFRKVENMLNPEESAGYRRIFEKSIEKGIDF